MFEKKLDIMTPGPTQVSEQVMKARSMPCTNPDLDMTFAEDYRQLCLRISALLKTDKETFILGGEGILGLEAACASLTEPGDRVLVIDNGIFGRGFSDFVSMYGGVPVLYTRDYRETIDVDELARFLEKDHDFKYLTVVHGDTPSGMLNDAAAIARLARSYGIMTVIDAVSTMFGEPLDMSDIDILCGGSQKVISAPPGLTIVVLSQEAKAAISSRKEPIRSFYANLRVFFDYYENKWFPYTMPISDICGLERAISAIEADPDILGRHARIGSAVREAVTAAGLTLYANSGYSDTVTVFEVPSGLKADEILALVKTRHGIMLAGSFDILAGKVIRIGHMGNNADIGRVRTALAALDDAMNELGFSAKASMAEVFARQVGVRLASRE